METIFSFLPTGEDMNHIATAMHVQTKHACGRIAYEFDTLPISYQLAALVAYLEDETSDEEMFHKETLVVNKKLLEEYLPLILRFKGYVVSRIRAIIYRRLFTNPFEWEWFLKEMFDAQAIRTEIWKVSSNSCIWMKQASYTLIKNTIDFIMVYSPDLINQELLSRLLAWNRIDGALYMLQCLKQTDRKKQVNCHTSKVIVSQLYKPFPDIPLFRTLLQYMSQEYQMDSTLEYWLHTITTEVVARSKWWVTRGIPAVDNHPGVLFETLEVLVDIEPRLIQSIYEYECERCDITDLYHTQVFLDSFRSRSKQDLRKLICEYKYPLNYPGLLQIARMYPDDAVFLEEIIQQGEPIKPYHRHEYFNDVYEFLSYVNIISVHDVNIQTVIRLYLWNNWDKVVEFITQQYPHHSEIIGILFFTSRFIENRYLPFEKPGIDWIHLIFLCITACCGPQSQEWANVITIIHTQTKFNIQQLFNVFVLGGLWKHITWMIERTHFRESISFDFTPTEWHRVPFLHRLIRDLLQERYYNARLKSVQINTTKGRAIFNCLEICLQVFNSTPELWMMKDPCGFTVLDKLSSKDCLFSDSETVVLQIRKIVQPLLKRSEVQKDTNPSQKKRPKKN